MRAVTVRDLPVGLNRGYLHGNIGTFDETFTARCSYLYNVYFKFNKPVYKHLVFNYNVLKRNHGAWRDIGAQPEENRWHIKALGKLLTPLGIKWYGGFHPVIGKQERKWHGSEDDIKVLLHYARMVESAGGHFFIQLDDFRFPIHPYDREHFGTAREADIYILRTLLSKLSEEYPRARILVCPPFYWGPRSPAPEWYGEGREAYLSAVGKHLPEAIEIMWTGPKVRSTVIKREDVRWITKLIRRNPVVWQNGWDSPHPYYFHYATDPVRAWNDWLYDGFTQDVDSYMLNSSFPGCCALVATAGDYWWSPHAYDPERSIDEVGKKLVGTEAYRTLKVLNKTLPYFDPFQFSVSPSAVRRPGEMEAKLEEVKLLWKKAQSQSQAVSHYTGFERYISLVERYVGRLKKNPEPSSFVEYMNEVERRAKEEASYSQNSDILLSPYDFIGGYGPRHYANRCEKRLSVWVYGTHTPYHTVRATFRVDPFPPAGDYLLIVIGQDDEAERRCRMRVSINGKKIFEGDCPFVRFGWSKHNFKVPGSALKAENTLVMENLDEGYGGGAPWFMINYALLRPLSSGR